MPRQTSLGLTCAPVLLQELFGGRQELGAAVLRSPRILLMGVDMVRLCLLLLVLTVLRMRSVVGCFVVRQA